MAAYEVLLLNTAIPQIQAAQSGDTYVVPRDIAINATATITGNLGVGASSPTAKLDVLGSGDTDVRIRAGSDAALIFSETSANKNWRLKPSSGDFFFQYSATAYNSGYSALAVLTSTGNLGLGVTPSSWDLFKPIQINQGSLSSSGNAANNTVVGSNIYYNAGWKYVAASARATMYQQETGAHLWWTTGTTTGSAGGAAPLSQAMTLDASGNLKVGGTANRATTAGTNHLDIFNGTAPVGTLTNGISIYSSSGEAYVMDAAGNATLFSPHDAETNEWIFKSKHTPTGKVLKIDVERLLKFVNDHFGLDAVHEFVEE